MYYFYRTVMLTLVWLSLLVLPFMAVSYLCYGELCGGPASGEIADHPYYLSIIGYSTLLYPFIVFYCLYHSRQLTKLSFRSTSILWVPLVCLIPFAYVTYQTRMVYAKYKQQEIAYHSIHPDDFVCPAAKSAIKFIRSNPSEPGRFSFFDGQPHPYGTSWSVSVFYRKEELEAFLKRNNIEGSQCINQKRTSFSYE